jgi:hypothetical protein
MAKDDEQEKRALRDTTKPEHRPSWGVSRDNAPKGASPINWGDSGVPVPTPGGTGTRKKTGLFKGGVKAPARAPEPDKPRASPKEITGLFKERQGEDRVRQILHGSSGQKDAARGAQETPRATIHKDGREVVFRRKGREDDPDRGR